VTAYELAKRGHEVLVLERDVVAAGASGGPGWRGVRANARDPRELPLASRAYDLWGDLGYQRTGHLQITEREEGLPALRELAEQQGAVGVPSTVVGRAELAELEPDIADTVIGAVWCGNVAEAAAVYPAVGEALAQWITSGQRPESLRPFTASRFG
jgi:sarcosine oxidase subunit beta